MIVNILAVFIVLPFVFSYNALVVWFLWGPFERFMIKHGAKPTNWEWQNKFVQWMERVR